MRHLFALFVFLSLVITSCKKNNPPCYFSVGDIPTYPYENPIWHPNGNLLGFNYSPLSGVGKDPCEGYMDGIKTDSIGFYIMNKDGTGLKRMTNFYLTTPAWSPDGNWLAFSFGSQLYKIRFTGTDFDSTNIVQLTDSAANFFPSWTANSDTIFYDSDAGTNGQGYYIWKMASDGSGKTGFPGTGREPFVGSDNRIYYVGLQYEIFSMNKDGTDKKQLTFTNNTEIKENPKYYNGNLFYWNSEYVYTTPINTFLPKQLFKCPNDGDFGYDVSKQGQFVYATAEFPLPDIRFGTLWTADSDGNNKKQITFNHY